MTDEQAKRPKRPSAPAGLGTRGKGLWRRLVARYDFEQGELPLLEQACRALDDVTALEEVVAGEGMTVAGSRGQPRLNPAVAELRQSRQGFAKLIGALALPNEDDERPMTVAQRRAQRAANARWKGWSHGTTA